MAYQSEYIGTDIDKGISLALAMYPVGSIYLSVNNVNPSTIFGGTWEQIQDRFLLAAGSTYGAGTTGGSATHTHTTGDHILTVAETPAHTHTRGTMDISGAITCYSHYNKGNEDYWKNACKGAFYKNTSDYTEDASTLAQSDSATSDSSRKVSFLASKTWTGATSSIGGGAAHNHGNTGSSSSLPPYLAIYVWKRTAQRRLIIIGLSINSYWYQY